MEDGLRPESYEILVDGSLRHPGTVRKELLDIVLVKVRCEVTCDREADAVFGQRLKELRETPRYVRDLDPKGHGAFAQTKTLHAVVEEILVPALEVGLSSRHLRDMSDEKGNVWFLGPNQLLG
jgi:hypothetical protein